MCIQIRRMLLHEEAAVGVRAGLVGVVVEVEARERVGAVREDWIQGRVGAQGVGWEQGVRLSLK